MRRFLIASCSSMAGSLPYGARVRNLLAAAVIASVVLTACGGDDDAAPTTTTATTVADAVPEWQVDLSTLADDDMDGRDNGTEGSARAQAYLLERLGEFTEPLGDDVHHPFAQGVNLLAVIRGTELPDEYVILGAHYDHLGHDCGGVGATDDICNGATDNAASVAEVLEIGRRLAREPVRRSVVIALWDAEEDGLLGSRAYVADPAVPLDATTVYLNWDNQGSNLLPSLRDLTVLVGAETGGPALVAAAKAAADASSLSPVRLSLLFGQGRSDHAVFAEAGVPTVFSTDATNGCYHTVDDDLDAIDLDKLRREIDLGESLARGLADTDTPPAFTAGTPSATFDDASSLLDVLHRGEDDIDLLPTASQPTMQQYVTDLEAIVAAGPDAFDDAAIGRLLGGAVDLVQSLTEVPCDSFALTPP
jgi:hypothetical protein